MSDEKELGKIFHEAALPIAEALWPRHKSDKWEDVPAEDRNFMNQALAAFLKVMTSTPDAAGATGGARNDLPEVGGRRLTTSIADFEQKCRVTLGDLQQNHFADTHLIGLLCEAVRLSREHVDYVRDHIGWMPNPALPVASSQPSNPIMAAGRKEFESRYPGHRFKCEHCDNWQSEHEMGPNGVPLYCPRPQPPESRDPE